MEYKLAYEALQLQFMCIYIYVCILYYIYIWLGVWNMNFIFPYIGNICWATTLWLQHRSESLVPSGLWGEEMLGSMDSIHWQPEILVFYGCCPKTLLYPLAIRHIYGESQLLSVRI